MKAKILSKVTAIVLTLALVASLAVTSFAISSSDKGTITVSGVEDTATVTAYRLVTANIDATLEAPVEPRFIWADEMVDWITTNYPSYIDSDNTVNAKAVDEVFNASDVTEADAKAFYEAVAAAIKAGTITPATTASGTGNGSIEVEMGNYIVLVSGTAKVYAPMAANVVPNYNTTSNAWEVLSDTETAAKATEPTVTKTLKNDDDSVAIGDTVSYEVVATVPTYDAVNSKDIVFKISDKVSTGLTLNATTINVASNNGDLTVDTDYTVTSDSDEFTVTLKDATILASTSITVTYSATVNDEAVVNTAMTNKASLEYSNDPVTTTSTNTKTTDEVKVYTYGFDLVKVEKGTVTKLNGAEFTLSEGNTAIAFVKVADGEYRVATADDTNTTTTLVATTGTLLISGLDVGEYSLKETKAPDGYNLPSSAKTIEIKGDEADGYADVTIENSKGFTLPTTGGIGTMLFTAAGILLVLAGIVCAVLGVYFVSRKRRA